MAMVCSDQDIFDAVRNGYLVESFCKFLGFRELADHFREVKELIKNNVIKINNKQEAEGLKKSFSAFEPKVVYENQKFDPI